MTKIQSAKTRQAWNAGMIVGPKAPLKPKHIWEIRTRLNIGAKLRDLALFNLAIDSKLRIADVMADGATSAVRNTTSFSLMRAMGAV